MASKTTDEDLDNLFSELETTYVIEWMKRKHKLTFDQAREEVYALETEGRLVLTSRYTLVREETS